ncbi:MAG: FAD-dependent oxidoreductase [Anaeromicrobium sp.]|jgi:flavin-dependent dehydrogenase|uniref:NAD(P)/FAD-dependent oxidoreductase n=1 Tax=Anaeromicrobium sp. TaxID=1929132 RepID=UPI0025F26738|nr:FAD-dependent oxidoreductase [Anaeromicrobium sp.]MCT4594287.1 FAD-dependent oxidoreductase [Anaeromicrobium sp.]
MKVAIVGGGVAGLSCAHQLEKYNISYTIFERNNYIGEGIPHVAAFLNILDRTKGDPIKYFRKNYKIKIKELSPLNKIVHHSPNETTILKKSKMGYLVYRGNHENSLKNQIFNQLKNPNIIFSTMGNMDELSKEYDHVIWATGNHYGAWEKGCWQNWVKTIVKGAVIRGNFTMDTLIVWINKDYCKQGYAYLTPIDKKTATLLLIVTDIKEKEMDMYWTRFLETENIRNKILQSFMLEHMAGYCYPRKINNIYFVGNAAGGIDPFLGFGQLNSITQGVMAARSIAKNKSYDKLIDDLVKRNLWMHEFRKKYNKMTNKDYDKLIKAIGTPGIKHAMYYTNMDVVKWGGTSFSIFDKIKNKIL